MLARINAALDGLVRPEVPILGAPRSAFQVCGFVGWIVGSAASLGLAWWTGASPWVIAILILTASVAFLLVAAASKLVVGHPRLVFYHHAIAIVAAVVGVLLALGEPVLPYVDLSTVALATFLSFGRVGCLMVGCCHGKPAHVGVRYRDEHVSGGFEHVLVGVRLFPTQAIEAVVALALAVVCALMIAHDAEAGAPSASVALVYAACRYLLELARGDRFRPIVGGTSEAQWISVLAAGGVMAAELTGVLPYARWHVAVAAGLGFAWFFVAFWRFLGHAPRHRLLHPAHIHDMAVALDTLAAPGNRAAVIVATTSLGIQLSYSRHASQGTSIEHVAISQRGGPLPEENARIVSDLVCLLRPDAARREVVVRGNTYHLLLHR